MDTQIKIKARQRRKYFFHLAWPAAAEGFFIHLLSSVDLLMAGSLGSKAQAAIGIISQPRMMALLFVRAFAVALTAVIARRYGQGRKEEVEKLFKQSTLLTAIFYFIFLLLCLVFFPQILQVAGAQNSYRDWALVYGNLVFIGVFFTALSGTINAGLIALGQTKAVFVANVAGNIANCTLNYGFIYGALGLPKLGIKGIGLATIAGNILSLLISAYFAHSKDIPLGFSTKGWKIEKEYFIPILKVLKGSLPEQFFERIGMFAYTIMVARLGLLSMAVHHIAMNLCDIFYSMAMGLGVASAAITGQMLGKGNREEAFLYGKVGQRMALFLASLGFVVFISLRQELMGLFSSDRGLIEAGSKILIFVALASFPQSLSLSHSGLLKGAGDTQYVAKYSIIIIAILRPALTYGLVYGMDLSLLGAWISLLIDQSLRAIAASRRFYSKKWQNISL